MGDWSDDEGPWGSVGAYTKPRIDKVERRPSWMCRFGTTCERPHLPRDADGKCPGCPPLNGSAAHE